MIRVEVIFVGHVQGVGFRWTAARAAREAGVAGWVRNEPDGTVRLIAEGQPAQIESLLQLIRTRMHGHIRDERVSTSEASGEFDGFEIKP